MERLAFTASMADSMRLSDLFSASDRRSEGLRLVAYRHLDNGKHFLSGCWWGGQVQVSAREFSHLSLLIGAVNTHGLPKEITNA